MTKINILKSEIYNRIAAGEVVERPASVVKELVENSIDAGAKSISVEIKDGGTKLIKVIDDGQGIEKDYVKTAFLPHATSKISNVSDLENISTLGFRGEALASIAAVSMITLKTKTKNDETAVLLELKAGQVTNFSECALSCGSVICVENLFFNTPARLKFLKSKKTEESEITNVITRFILANPNLNFKYTVDDKIIYDYTGKDLLTALHTIYGESVYNNVLEINYEKNGYKLCGYIGKPDFSKSNKTYQTLIINDRFVTNSLISMAVYNAYGGFLMTKKYPFFVLNFKMPNDCLDVNVHPNKADVRFADNNVVYGIFYKCIFNCLTQNTTFNSIMTENKIAEPFNNPIINITPSLNNAGDSSFNKSAHFEKIKTPFNEFNEDFQYTFENKEFKQLKVSDSDVNLINSNQIQDVMGDKESIQESMPITAQPYKIVGTAFNTYIILEMRDCILFIDQHAAMERILYDKLKNNTDSKKFAVQPLLVPYILNVNSTESRIIFDNLEIFKSLGFNIEEFGNNSYKVSEVPIIFEGLNFDKFFSLFFNEDANIKAVKHSDLIKDKLAQIACKASIKAGDMLNTEDIENLVANLNGLVLLCPHGRPIVVKYSKTDIEKWFKRII